MQRRRCIKWLKGHMDTITGVMYNCRDEHLASISIRGDLILHNLASGTRAAELKDPHDQVLRVLEYSRLSRDLLVTAGDDSSLHIWDTTNRSPKMSWLKQHSTPTSGVCFSPGNDKTDMQRCGVGGKKKGETHGKPKTRDAGLLTDFNQALSGSGRGAGNGVAGDSSAASPPFGTTYQGALANSECTLSKAALGQSERKKRKLWSLEEDQELMSAVEKFGEGNWTNILKGSFTHERTAAQLSQRWALIRKRRESHAAANRLTSSPSPSEDCRSANER